MKLFGFFILYAVILIGGWEIQKYDLLLGHTLGVLGILAATIWAVDSMARKWL